MITEIQIIPVKSRDGLVAFANIVFDNSLFLGSIGVHRKLDGFGLRLTYPTKKVGGRDFHIFHPISKVISREIEEAIFAKLKNVMTKSDDRYRSTHL